MYSASADFHAAVKNGNPQMPLLIFKNAVFTSEDIDVNTGIEFDDLFCTEDNISIGQALMNSIRFALFNDNQYLNDYEFGEFIATIGVRLTSTTYTQTGNISLTVGDNEYIAYSTSPYITRNGTALAVQPSAKPTNIIAYKGKVYCFLTSGGLYIYDDATGDRLGALNDNIFDESSVTFVNNRLINDQGEISTSNSYKYCQDYIPVKPNTIYTVQVSRSSSSAAFTVPLYDKNKGFVERNVAVSTGGSTGTVIGSFRTGSTARFMRFSCGKNTYSDIVICENVPNAMLQKFKRATYYGAYFNDTTNILTLNKSGASETYEFVPLGTFNANRPDAPDVKEITLSCDDRMKKFEANMPDDTALGITYPATIGTLFTKMCNYLGVPYVTDTFINSTATISKRPDQFNSVTMRTVLQWIAEAAGSNARFNRDGKLAFVWLNTTSSEYDEGDYSNFSPYWYETQKVDMLYNRDSQGGTDGTYGNGSGGYLILDNPLMKGAS